MSHFTKLNIIFALELFTVVLAVAGVFPREVFLFLAGVLVFFFLFSSLEESVLLVARSIPLFVALPLSDSFDSLNTWRIAVLALFLKWFFTNGRVRFFFGELNKLAAAARRSIAGGMRLAWNAWRIETLATLFLLVSVISLCKVDDVVLGIKRIIYFANLWMLFFIVRSAVTRANLRALAVNAVVGASVVVLVGVFQLALAYLIDVDSFSEFWALQVNKTLYGTAWANIAISANTWFAYYNDTIHLRMFSSFPDTHSFPLYLLMAVCFAATLALFASSRLQRFFLFVFIALAMAEAVLSGTRGIWVSALFPLLALGYLAVRKYAFPRLVWVPFAAFLVCLPLSSVVFGSTQFKLAETGQERAVLAERIKSIIDTGETSNQGRVYIWKESLRSIIEHPLLGVGVGNFPVVLSLDPMTIKAGASAHNLYLNMLAELGILGFAVFGWIVYEIMRAGWRLYLRHDEAFVRFFALNFLLYFIWILWYSMTDVAIFDERAFLLFMVLLGALFAFYGTERKEQTARLN